MRVLTALSATRIAVGLIVLAQAASLAVFALPRRNMLPNPDAITYLRLASYYAAGDLHLAVSGYFGPLFSWLMVPLLLAGANAIDAARVVVGLSSVLFTLGSFRLFRSFGLAGGELVLAALLTAAAAAAWALRETSPDLLLGALMCFGVAAVIAPAWRGSARAQLASGLWWGLAYLAKAVALPLAVAVFLAVAVRLVIGRLAGFRSAARAVALAVLGALLVAGPWIAVISWKYRAPTLSTSARINHAIVGPPDVERDHPGFRTFHVPETGRLTSWEDPTYLPYAFWSPLASRAYAIYQAKLVFWNFTWIAAVLNEYDRLGLGVAAAVLALLIARPWREAIGGEPWRWCSALIAIMILPYLPVYSNADRYYYAVYPLLLVAALGFATALLGDAARSRNLRRVAVLAAIAVSFAQDPAAWRSASAFARELPASYAADLARKLKAAGITGPVAGAGKDPGWPGGEHAHLYVAYYLDTPDLGAEPDPTPDRAAQSGAALLVVPRNTDVARALARDPRFRDLDAVLAGSAGAALPPLKVFALSSSASGEKSRGHAEVPRETASPLAADRR